MGRTNRIGILGGGQLSRMLIQAAEKLGLEAIPLVDSPLSPAARVARTKVVYVPSQSDVEGQMEALEELFNKTEVVIFENEFVDCGLLAALTQDREVPFVPRLFVIRALQDKLSQKKILAQAGIPTVEMLPFSDENGLDDSSLKAWLVKVGDRFPTGSILKWSKFGYDGYGNFHFTSDSKTDEALKFLKKGLSFGAGLFAEEYVDFLRELAITAVHSITGDLVFYPLVETKQESGACKWVRGPATSFGVEPPIEVSARQIAETLAKKLPIQGAFAVEFFLTRAGKLLVNEIAPRVHNSSHYSMDACETSQFENHLRAVTGQPLGSTQTTPFFGMINLLGPRDLSRSALEKLAPVPELVSVSGVSVHWYQKQRLTPGRKMGHLNGVAASKLDFDAVFERLGRADQEWVRQIEKAISS